MVNLSYLPVYSDRKVGGEGVSEKKISWGEGRGGRKIEGKKGRSRRKGEDLPEIACLRTRDSLEI